MTQGIGQGRVTGNVDGSLVDSSFRIPDLEVVELLDRLAEEDGLLMGGSAGMNVAGAVRLAEKMGPGHTIATLLCDHGSRYQSQLWDPAFRRAKGFGVPAWLEGGTDLKAPLVG